MSSCVTATKVYPVGFATETKFYNPFLPITYDVEEIKNTNTAYVVVHDTQPPNNSNNNKFTFMEPVFI